MMSVIDAIKSARGTACSILRPGAFRSKLALYELWLTAKLMSRGCSGPAHVKLRKPTALMSGEVGVLNLNGEFPGSCPNYRSVSFNSMRRLRR